MKAREARQGPASSSRACASSSGACGSFWRWAAPRASAAPSGPSTLRSEEDGIHTKLRHDRQITKEPIDYDRHLTSSRKKPSVFFRPYSSGRV